MRERTDHREQADEAEAVAREYLAETATVPVNTVRDFVSWMDAQCDHGPNLETWLSAMGRLEDLIDNAIDAEKLNPR